jgi:inorganic pyrophosphatase
MADERGGDEKIITVPIGRLNPYYSKVHSLNDLPTILHEQIAHCFCHYKDLEEGKWVDVSRWMELTEANDYILKSIARVSEAAFNGRRYPVQSI